MSSKKWSLGAYVRAYEQCEENSDVWIRDDDLEFYEDKFSDEQEMAYFAEQSDATDETTSLFGDIMDNAR